MPFSERNQTYGIIFFVIAIHCCLIAGLAFQREILRPPQPRQRLVVQTIALAKESPPQQQVQPETASLVAKNEVVSRNVDIETATLPQKSAIKESKVSEPVKKPGLSEPIKKPSPVVKKSLPKSESEVKKPVAKVLAAAPKAVPKPDPTPKPMKDIAAEAEDIKKRKLLAEIKKNIVDSTSTKATLEGVKGQRAILSSPPKMLSDLQTDALPSTDFNYDHELARKLKLLLQLPQYGEVEVLLTLFRSGKVAKLIVLSSVNAKNKEHVEKILPTLSFPPFGSTFAGEEQHAFRITLSNAL